ncbi:MAG: STAS/SEC14 domain-containing protein [Desulfobacter sp.]|nr:MAG: STAS/SEC14 domain-containing protein [Desulfobacter sp.]
MIEMIDIGMADAIAYRIDGKVTEDEMKTILAAFKEKAQKNEKLIVYQEVVSIGGAEVDALIEKFKFFLEFGLSHFSRIAVVTHKKWIHKLVDIEGKFLKDIEMRGFPEEEKEQAIAFLRNG